MGHVIISRKRYPEPYMFERNDITSCLPDTCLSWSWYRKDHLDQKMIMCIDKQSGIKVFSHLVSLLKREKKFIKRQRTMLWLFWWCVCVCSVGLNCRELCAMLDYVGVVCVGSSLFMYIHRCMYSCVCACMLLNCLWEYVWVAMVRIF